MLGVVCVLCIMSQKFCSAIVINRTHEQRAWAWSKSNFDGFTQRCRMDYSRKNLQHRLLRIFVVNSAMYWIFVRQRTNSTIYIIGFNNVTV